MKSAFLPFDERLAIINGVIKPAYAALMVAATRASSGSTPAGSDIGTGTLDGADDAGTTAPPSKRQSCARE